MSNCLNELVWQPAAVIYTARGNALLFNMELAEFAINYSGWLLNPSKHLRKLFRKSLDNIFRAENSTKCGRIAPAHVVFVLRYGGERDQ